MQHMDLWFDQAVMNPELAAEDSDWKLATIARRFSRHAWVVCQSEGLDAPTRDESATTSK